MKKNLSKWAIVIAVSTLTIKLSAQTQVVNQIIIGESTGSSVYVSSYNPTTGLTTVFDTIHEGYVQDVVVNGSFAYVAASDSIIKYNIDTYQRISECYFENIHMLAVYNNQLLAGKWISSSDNNWLRVFNANDLSQVLYDVTEIDDQTYDITVVGDTAYAVVYGGYGNSTGKIAAINLTQQSFSRFIDMGNQGEGIGNLLTDNTNLYPVFETWKWNTPADTMGGVGIYNIGNGSLFIDSMKQNIGRGYFVNGTALFLQVDDNIGVYDLFGQQLIDPSRISVSVAYSSFAAVVFDRVNSKIYANETDYFSYGTGRIFDLAGNELGTYNVGISAEAMDIDYRTSTSEEITEIDPGQTILYPNPSHNFIYLSDSKSKGENYIVFSADGRVVLNGTFSGQINISALDPGMYFLKLNGNNGSFTFIKN